MRLIVTRTTYLLRRSVLAVLLVVTGLPGCFGPKASIDIPPLQDGDEAEYVVDGAPLNAITGVYGRFPDDSGAPTIPFVDQAFIVRADGPHTIIGPDGAPLPGTWRLQYHTRSGERTYLHGEEYLAGNQVMATTEWVREGDQNVPSHTWAKGIPDLFFVALFQGRDLQSGRHGFDLDAPSWIFWVARTSGRLVFDVDIEGDVATAELQLSNIDEGERYDSLQYFWDESCPFPASARLQRTDGSFAFRAERVRCTRGEEVPLVGDVTGVLSSPSPHWQEPPSMSDFSPGLTLDGSSQADAWGVAQPDLMERCGGGCRIVSLRLQYREFVENEGIPVLEQRSTFPVWGFAAVDDAGSVHFTEVVDDGEPRLVPPEEWSAIVGSGDRMWTFDVNALRRTLDHAWSPSWELVSRTVHMDRPGEAAEGGHVLSYGPAGQGPGAHSLRWQADRFGFLEPFNGELDLVL